MAAGWNDPYTNPLHSLALVSLSVAAWAQLFAHDVVVRPETANLQEPGFRGKRDEALEAIARRVRFHGVGFQRVGAVGVSFSDHSRQELLQQTESPVIAFDVETRERPDRIVRPPIPGMWSVAPRNTRPRAGHQRIPANPPEPPT